MNKPTSFAFVMGNNFSLTCAAAFSAYWLLFLAVTGIANGLALACGLGVLSIAWKARRRIRAFPYGSKTPVRQGSLFMAMIVWSGAVAWVGMHPDDNYSKSFEISCMLFSIASLALLLHVARLLAMTIARLRSLRAKHVKEEHHTVVQCLKLPLSSPEIAQITAALPSYAARCLSRS